MKETVCLSLLLVVCLLPSLSSADNGRFGLVVGNAEYQELTPLRNPDNDAAAVADKLHDLGFVLLDTQGRIMERPRPLLDLNAEQFTYAIQAFAERVNGAEIAFVYYAGHGMQIDGRSQLLPVDTPLPDIERDRRLRILRRYAQPLDIILEDLDGKADLTVAVFDACREIPNLDQEMRSLSRSTGAFTNAHRGLARITRTGRSRIVAFSGGFGQLVADGRATEHSPYTSLLLQHLDDPDAPVERVFQQVAFEFGRKHGGQDPEVLTQGVEPERFYLTKQRASSSPSVNPLPRPEPASTADTSPRADLELVYWGSADRCGTADCLAAYLKKYPSGEFAALAKIRLEALNSQKQPRPNSQPATVEPALFTQTRRLNPKGDNFLSMRSGPGGHYTEIYRIYNNGTRVKVLAQKGDWIKVTHQGHTGWSHSAYLTSPSQN
ncbi:caspase family protein [Lamprobacter modestohalophilus]|uniref:caspase family protein n=1 Tax=Lamprobacter modestohalophilus TaxID=1064514 RepID=UPI002ADEAD47|nr:caspase family protein [Lamprobacter modestohalophilus]MEA1051875.1 caspase family protein [Lamprobacter modestohalophilus]